MKISFHALFWFILTDKIYFQVLTTERHYMFWSGLSER